MHPESLQTLGASLVLGVGTILEGLEARLRVIPVSVAQTD